MKELIGPFFRSTAAGLLAFNFLACSPVPQETFEPCKKSGIERPDQKQEIFKQILIRHMTGGFLEKTSIRDTQKNLSTELADFKSSGLVRYLDQDDFIVTFEGRCLSRFIIPVTYSRLGGDSLTPQATDGKLIVTIPQQGDLSEYSISFYQDINTVNIINSQSASEAEATARQIFQFPDGVEWEESPDVTHGKTQQTDHQNTSTMLTVRVNDFMRFASLDVQTMP